ncbi:uncharacterized protein [Rutidosis leptorrhynchoides]|uniref:uncharacterized protein n=1 Tax=Rutidosis leptorrhynchoides TaxID=125765 RepID=UPI003A98FFCB
MGGFLWCQGEMKRGKAKVKWSVVCLPKDEGGLGGKSLKKWNVALSGGSRIICHWGKEIRQLFVHVIGNGQSTSAWHDTFSDFGLLSNVISAREIHRAEYKDGATVADLMSRFPDVTQCDKIMWKARDGNLVDFSTKAAWESVRNHGDKVEWHNLICFSSCIPRHAFIAWLLMLEKLKTQDKMFPWDVGDGQNGPMLCSLCKTQQDSHNHLFLNVFFQGKFGKDVVV